MAFPTLPAFDYQEPEVFVVKIGTSVAHATGQTGRGQVKSVSGRTTSDMPKKSFRRVGSATVVNARGPAEYESTCDITLYESQTMADWLAVLNTTSPASLTSTSAVTIVVEVYDSISSGTLKHYWSLVDAYPIEVGFDVGADDDAVMTPLRFVSDNKWTMTTA